MDTEGKVGWEELVDPRLDGKFDKEELNEVAALAHKCVDHVARRRPAMRDIVQVLSKILKSRHNKKHHKNSATQKTDDQVIVNIDQLRQKNPVAQHQRVESLDSMADSIDI